MPGTKAGGIKAAQANLARDPNFYSSIGRKGGSVLTPTGGFGHPEPGKDGLTGQQRARLAGIIGGQRSKRGSKQK